MDKIIVLYIPVLHEGYLRFFKKYANEVDCLYIIGEDIISELMPQKEIRAIHPLAMQRMAQALSLFRKVRILEPEIITDLSMHHIITANESISKKLVEKYLSKARVTFDSIFLRWDEQYVNTQSPVNFDSISTDEFDRDIIALAETASKNSSDWWRHVGAVIIKEGKILLEGYNRHVPSEHTPYTFGDIRDFIEAGKLSHISSALHAEQSLIAEAAKQGFALAGTHIYTTTFPCPLCAKLIAYSGISKCFFSKGHASFDGEQVLKANCVEIILVK